MDETEWLNRCHFGDVRDVLRRMIADGVQVNTIVSSPPYWGLRDYGVAGQIGLEPTLHEFINTLVEVFDLCRRVLSDDGTMWVNMGDSYASRPNGPLGIPKPGGIAHHVASRTAHARRSTSMPHDFKHKDLIGQPWRLAFALQDAGWWLRQDIIWHKPNPMPESARDRCTKAHEYVFLLSKSARYYYDFDAMQEPVSGTANPRRAQIKTPVGWDTSTGNGGHGSFHKDGREGVGHRTGPAGNPAPRPLTNGVGWGYADGSLAKPRTRKVADSVSGTKNNANMDAALADMATARNKRSVWTVASEPYSGAHFATFPTKLIEPCILAGSRAGGVVLDPFFGSGTTGQVAQALGRQFIGIELNPAYKALQDERLRQPSLRLEAA